MVRFHRQLCWKDPIMKFCYWIMMVATGVLMAVAVGNAAEDSLEDYFFPNKAGAWEYKLSGYNVLRYQGKDLGCKMGPEKPFCDKVQLIFDIARANRVFNPLLGFQARATTSGLNGATAPIPMSMAAGCCLAFCAGCSGSEPEIAIADRRLPGERPRAWARGPTANY